MPPPPVSPVSPVSAVTPLAVGSLPSSVLADLARDIAEAHAGHDHATLVRVRPRPGGVEVGLCSLPAGIHPSEALAGHVVPPRWAASGVVAPAWARPLEEAAARGTGTPTTVAMLVGREGPVTSHAVGVAGIEAGAEAPTGRIPDLLLRTLGRPTPAPTVSAAAWWRARWLDAVVAAAAADPARPPDRQRPLTGTLPVPLVQALVDEPELCTVAGWARLRQLAAAADPPEAPGPAAVRAAIAPHVEPALAAWMDDGCFSRWLLDALPSIDELLGLAAGLVDPDVLDLLHEVARGAGEGAPQGARGGADPPR